MIGLDYQRFVWIALLLMSASSMQAQNLGLDVASASCQSLGQDIAISNFVSIEGPEADILEGIQITISENYNGSEDFFTYNAVQNINGSFDSNNGIFTLSGQAPIAEYRQALDQLFFKTVSTNYDSKSINVILSGVDFFVESGHFYQFFPASGISWSAARTEAEEKELFGLKGYLTTITTANENQFILERVSGTAWIGASDLQQEGDWRWVTGPEAEEDQGRGRRLSAGFTNWDPGEPNNAGPEHYAHMMDWTSPEGQWNDLPDQGGGGQYFPTGYIVEYGGLPGDPDILDRISGTSTIDWERSIDLTGSTSVCPNIQGVIYTATALDGHSYAWKIDGGTITNGAGTNEITVDWGTTNSSASVSVKVKSDISCEYNQSLSVRINEQLEPPLPIGNEVICFSDLNSNQVYSTPFTPGSNYEWKITNGTIISGQGTNEIEVLWGAVGTGSLFFTESTTTATDICDGDSPVLSVDLREEIIPQFDFNHVTCFGESNGQVIVDIVSSGTAISYNWIVPVSAEIDGNKVSGLAAGTYSVEVTVDDCLIEFPFTITEPDELLGSVNTQAVLCFGESNGTAEAIVNGGTGDYRYLWSHDPNQTSSFVNNLPAGNHSVEIFDENDCQLVLNFTITEPELLVIDEIIATLVSCPGGNDGTLEAIVSGGTLPYSYEWEFSSDTESLATGFPKGQYRVTVTDANGCQASNTQKVEEAIPKVVLPNSFSPNGDGINDTFGPLTPCDITFKMEIYNRWGQVIFSTNNSQDHWEGSFQGQKLMMGNYSYSAFWVINANEIVIKESKSGEILLLN
jgi:gliding motility-associated-like protein